MCSVGSVLEPRAPKSHKVLQSMAAIRNVELKNLGDGCSGAEALVDYPGAHKQDLQLTEIVRDFVVTPERKAKWSHIAKALKQSPMYVEAEVDLPNVPKMVLRIMDEGVVELRQEMDAQGFKSYSKTDTAFTLGGKLPAKSRDLIEENSAMTAISLNTFYHIAGVPIGDSDRSDAQHYACFSPPLSPEDGVNKGSKAPSQTSSSRMLLITLLLRQTLRCLMPIRSRIFA